MNSKAEKWIRTLLGVYLVGYALNHFVHLVPTSYGAMPEVTENFIDSIIMYLPYMYFFEILVGLLLIFNKYTGFLLIMLFPLSFSFMMFNIINGNIVMLWPAILVAALNIILLAIHKDRYQPLFE
ncbi:MAG: hypothetical protein ACFHWX_09500 [Bacteroidota bacterium]